MHLTFKRVSSSFYTLICNKPAVSYIYGGAEGLSTYLSLVVELNQTLFIVLVEVLGSAVHPTCCLALENEEAVK